MRIGPRCRDAAALGTCNESLLHQIRFVDLLDGIGLFTDRSRKCFDPDRPTIKFGDVLKVVDI